MRSMRSVLIGAGAIVALSLWAPTVSATSTPHAAHLIKDCSAYDGVVPSHCIIHDSDFAAIPVGTYVWYMGPVLTNNYFLSSNVVLDDEAGDTANGYCIFETKSSKGFCTFWQGTGSLAGFHAIFEVTIDALHLWHWDGTYYFTDDADASYAAAPRHDHPWHARRLIGS